MSVTRHSLFHDTIRKLTAIKFLLTSGTDLIMLLNSDIYKYIYTPRVKKQDTLLLSTTLPMLTDFQIYFTFRLGNKRVMKYY